MKKILVVLLAIMMLVGCSTGTDKPKDEDKDQPLKVALLVGSLGDMSFNDSAAAGVNKAKAELKNVEVKIIEYGTAADKFEATFVDTADAGYDMILSGSTMQEYVQKYAPEYKDSTFVIFDSQVDYTKGDLSNVYSIVYKANEASFLGGYLAAATSDTGVIGFLGGTDQPIISDFLVGFIQGAKEANPNIKVATSYVGSWSDSAKGKELSFAMYNQNASLVFNVAGGSGVGAIEAGVERKKAVLGVDSDQAMKYKGLGNESYASVIVSSVLKNVGDSLYRAIDLKLKGELKVGATETLGIKEGGVGLADNEYYQNAVSAEIRAKIAELEGKVTGGQIVVDTAYGMTTDQVNTIRESVKP